MKLALKATAWRVKIQARGEGRREGRPKANGWQQVLLQARYSLSRGLTPVNKKKYAVA